MLALKCNPLWEHFKEKCNGKNKTNFQQKNKKMF